MLRLKNMQTLVSKAQNTEYGHYILFTCKENRKIYFLSLISIIKYVKMHLY